MTQTAIPSSSTQANVASPAVRIEKLSKWLDDRAILQNVDLRIGKGEYLAIIGANGAGKSTLLKILATLIPPTSGTIELFGKQLTRATVTLRTKIGLIGHQSMLYRDLSARENLNFFAQLYGISDPTDRADRMLRMIGLLDRANDPVKNFSRGMVQRVSIARALLHGPELILADEPFDGLDAPSVVALEELFAKLSASGKTIVLVNHDIEQTLRLAERAIVLRGGNVAIDQPTHRLYARELLSEVM
ncbi:MAG TPA: ABC transporter ATP-binding protein [Tepidisphaeraceae bacterium]|nr:ABC transporter ATP-binding protein [Tepidisphaeraceae bacterium]